MDIELIGSLEDVAARAVPASCVRDIDGWVARRSPGLSVKRANSVLPRRHGPADGMEAKLAACERFYEERGLLVRFQISPASQPHALDELLIDRGYTPGSPTAVQTCGLERLDQADDAPGPTAEIASAPTAGWWRTWQAGAGIEPSRLPAVAALFDRLGRAAAFATVRAALAALAGWARRHGATRGYLQVELDNRPALGLYRGAGFGEAYRYVYITRAPTA
jgi:GNAT superfamily N-acetyltransferase